MNSIHFTPYYYLSKRWWETHADHTLKSPINCHRFVLNQAILIQKQIKFEETQTLINRSKPKASKIVFHSLIHYFTFLYFFAGRPLAEYLGEFPLERRRWTRRSWCHLSTVTTIHSSRHSKRESIEGKDQITTTNFALSLFIFTSLKKSDLGLGIETRSEKQPNVGFRFDHFSSSVCILQHQLVQKKKRGFRFLSLRIDISICTYRKWEFFLFLFSFPLQVCVSIKPLLIYFTKEICFSLSLVLCLKPINIIYLTVQLFFFCLSYFFFSIFLKCVSWTDSSLNFFVNIWSQYFISQIHHTLLI